MSTPDRFPGFNGRDTVRWKQGMYDMIAEIVRDDRPEDQPGSYSSGPKRMASYQAGEWWPVSVVVTAQIGGVVLGRDRVHELASDDGTWLDRCAAECAVEAVAMANVAVRKILDRMMT